MSKYIPSNRLHISLFQSHAIGAIGGHALQQEAYSAIGIMLCILCNRGHPLEEVSCSAIGVMLCNRRHSLK